VIPWRSCSKGKVRFPGIPLPDSRKLTFGRSLRSGRGSHGGLIKTDRKIAGDQQGVLSEFLCIRLWEMHLVQEQMPQWVEQFFSNAQRSYIVAVASSVFTKFSAESCAQKIQSSCARAGQVRPVTISDNAIHRSMDTFPCYATTFYAAVCVIFAEFKPTAVCHTNLEEYADSLVTAAAKRVMLAEEFRLPDSCFLRMRPSIK